VGTVSARVPDALEEELETDLEDERLDRSTAIRRLLAEALETWRQERALERFGAGKRRSVNGVTVAHRRWVPPPDVCRPRRPVHEDDGWTGTEPLVPDRTVRGVAGVIERKRPGRDSQITFRA
jgi:hypothetical protein